MVLTLQLLCVYFQKFWSVVSQSSAGTEAVTFHTVCMVACAQMCASVGGYKGMKPHFKCEECGYYSECKCWRVTMVEE